MSVGALGASRQPVGQPRWIAASLNVKEGRDPLGLQTTTQDRLMPRLLPGILELSTASEVLLSTRLPTRPLPKLAAAC